MPLSLLTDEHISLVLAEQVRARRSDILIQSIHTWRGAVLRGKADALLLQAAHEEGLTLLTYDQKTIPLLLSEWALMGQQHSGVLFVDEQTMRSSDIGALVRALIAEWDLACGWDWTDRVGYLRPAHAAGHSG